MSAEHDQVCPGEHMGCFQFSHLALHLSLQYLPCPRKGTSVVRKELYMTLDVTKR